MGVEEYTMAFSANPRIALMARGARFLKATPWICLSRFRQSCFFFIAN